MMADALARHGYSTENMFSKVTPGSLFLDLQILRGYKTACNSSCLFVQGVDHDSIGGLENGWDVIVLMGCLVGILAIATQSIHGVILD